MSDWMSNPPPKRPTSADVARLAGVSRTTVSYVLNDAPVPLTDETRAAVRAAAAQLGYLPNLAAKSLAEGGSRLVVTELSRSAFGDSIYEVSRELASVLARHGLVLALHFESDDRGELLEFARSLKPRAVITMRPLEASDRARLSRMGVRLTSIDQEVEGGLPHLEETAAKVRLGYLHDTGHRRIAIAEMDIPARAWWSEVRREALLRVAAHRGMEIVSIMSLDASGDDAAPRVAEAHRAGATAVVAYNDEAALYVLHGIRRAGLRCPDDLAVIGEDGGSAAAVADPPLTTLVNDARAVASMSASWILSSLGIQNPQPSEITPRLVRRASA